MDGESRRKNRAEQLFMQSPEDLSNVIAQVLNKIISQPSTGSGEAIKGPLTRFHAKELPNLSGGVTSYLHRCQKFLPARKDALFLSLLYIRRIASDPACLELARKAKEGGTTFISLASPRQGTKKKHERPIVNGWTLHRLLLACLLIASKVCSSIKHWPTILLTLFDSSLAMRIYRKQEQRKLGEFLCLNCLL